MAEKRSGKNSGNSKEYRAGNKRTTENRENNSKTNKKQ